ncbi:MAG: nucleotidyltransferase domain-containing protein [Spirochaetaceae bacterium]|nr:nucleotidyltransferase domain-containing protein [Spirochaetaceae bacterium]
MDSKETLRQFYRTRATQKREDARKQRARYEALLPRIVEGVLERDPQVSRIVLFGSLAEQTEGVVRDIDLAIESSEFLKVSGWLLSLSEAIDVVDMNDLYPHIRDRVETKGRVLYERRD